MYKYIKDPLQITRRSFEQIRELTDLSRFDHYCQAVAMRLVHTCGNPDIVQALEIIGDPVDSGITAIRQKVPVLCDVEMVRNGLSKKHGGAEPMCFLNESDVPSLAQSRGETRSMVALEHWRPYLDNAIIVIGNAPTALFRYLEMLAAGVSRPALIIGMPVGFVGAAESKQALIEYANDNNIAAITLTGRLGGSALAAATYNAIAMAAANINPDDGYR